MSNQIDAYRRMAQWIATKYRMVDPPEFGTKLSLQAPVVAALSAPIDAEFDNIVADLAVEIIGSKSYPVKVDFAAALKLICNEIDAPAAAHIEAKYKCKAGVTAEMVGAATKSVKASFDGIVASLSVEMETTGGATGTIVADFGELKAGFSVVVQQAVAALFSAEYIATVSLEVAVAASTPAPINGNLQSAADFTCKTDMAHTAELEDDLNDLFFDFECEMGAIIYHLWGEYIDMSEVDFSNLIEKEVVKTEI